MRLSELNKDAWNSFPDCEVLSDDYGQIIIYTGLMRDPKDSGHDPELVDFEDIDHDDVPVCEVCGKTHANLYVTPTGHIHKECKDKDLAFGWDPNVDYEDKDE